ncbi:MAG TPA: hypothetical protein VLE48_06560 [Terriglobales bacterium]|nr:hypothetical protein [Terriglobales bacterium]
MNVILARSAPVAVVFRRGPSKWVELIKWQTDTDTFDFGQWFHGRIYAWRSDLSPDGTMLIYFAAKWNRRSIAESDTFLEDREHLATRVIERLAGLRKRVGRSRSPRSDDRYTHAWTAISRPPFLTALALWAKGDCWHGGGLFKDAKTVWLNHRPNVAVPHRLHKPKGLKVLPNPKAAGEDYPVYSRRLIRDGWMLKQEIGGEWRGALFDTTAAEIWEKADATGRFLLRWTRTYDTRFRESFSLVERNSKRELIDLQTADWADWDHRGRLSFSQDGKLLSASIANGNQFETRELADFNDRKPEALGTPEWAKRW